VRIIFVRHGSTSANEQRLFCGSTNNSLSIAGELQARKAARSLKNEQIDVWVCGTSKRTKQTLKIILEELVLPRDTAVVRDDIREIDFGKFENFSFDEINMKYPLEMKKYIANWENFTFPEGDNTKEYFEACKESISDIVNCYNDKNICIIGHKGYICACLCYLSESEQTDMFKVDIKCGGLIAVDL
jgi:alpha-ribazole phosphatase